MNQEYLLSALDEIRDAYLAEAAGAAKHRPRRALRWAAAAACLCVLAGGALALLPHPSEDAEPLLGVDGAAANAAEEDGGVTLPPMEVTLSKLDGAAADMVPFLIYGGRCYVGFDWLTDADALIGDYLGTATGLIDEWTPRDGYVELAGSISGEFYEVAGYDPAFLVCKPLAGGELLLLVNNNGITLRSGAELFDDRLRLPDGWESVTYQSRCDWYYATGESEAFGEESRDALDAFFAALCEAPALPEDAMELPEGASNIYDDLEVCHLFVEIGNGMTVHLRCFAGGYVMYAGLRGVCVQIPQDVFDAVCGAF